VTEDSTVVAAHLYSQIVKDVHAVSSARVAEAAKLLENTFRAVNIGMANEMARLCYALNIDTWEVIRAAATKPFGFMPFYPGPESAVTAFRSIHTIFPGRRDNTVSIHDSSVSLKK
jgi:UDP-N-acetyl-D-glucosamine dehydrogenase